MLKILKLKKASITDFRPNVIENEGDHIGKNKLFIPANKEWYNSVYTFNKKLIKLLPVSDNVIIKLIRGYFNMYSNKLEKKVKAPRIRTWKRRLSVRKIWVSKAELKHTNDKIIITLYVFNRQYNYYLNKFSKILNTWDYIFLKKMQTTDKSAMVLEAEGFNSFSPVLKITLKFLSVIRKQNKLLLDKLRKNNQKIINPKKGYVNFIKKYLSTEMFALRLKQIMLFNKLKFTFYYILPLKSLIEKIYKKKIEFNIVIVKNYHLNSDILAQIVTSKIRNRKNRVLKVLKASVRKIKTPILNKKTIIRVPFILTGLQNTIISDFLLKSNVNSLSKDLVNKALESFYNLKKTLEQEENLDDIVLDSLKYKVISGVKVQASGRLTRRITASRAIYKFKYVGTLKNVDSSFEGLSSVTSKGNQKLNVQYSLLKSKTKIGAFGLKGWVASY